MFTLDPLAFIRMGRDDRRRFIAKVLGSGDINVITDIRNLEDFEHRFNALNTTEDQLVFYEKEARTCPNDEYRQQNLIIYDQVFAYLYGEKNNGL